jgi:hypothetical protein
MEKCMQQLPLPSTTPHSAPGVHERPATCTAYRMQAAEVAEKQPNTLSIQQQHAPVQLGCGPKPFSKRLTTRIAACVYASIHALRCASSSSSCYPIKP